MKTKVAVFDFDGTLTISKQNSWARVWQELDALDLDEKYYNMYFDNKISYHEWLNLCFESFKTLGVNKMLLEKIANNLKLISGVEDVFKQLTKNGICIYILSGGIAYIIESVLGNLKNYVKDISATKFIFAGENLSDYVYEVFNPQNKQEFLRHIIKLEHVEPQQVIFVGNGKNDESAYLTGANTLCLNADDTNPNDKTIWHNHVETDNLTEILKYII